VERFARGGSRFLTSVPAMGRGLAEYGAERTLALYVALTALCVGCRREAPVVGLSPPRALERRSSGSLDSGVPELSPVPGDFRTRMTRMGERFLSRGHAEHFDAVIWANGEALSPRDAGAVLPEGAMLLEELTAEKGGADRPAGLFVMEKRAGLWRFVVVGTRGEVVSDARVAPCAECHREAKDFVFWW